VKRTRGRNKPAPYPPERWRWNRISDLINAAYGLTPL
jgi:hypothetical protein